MKVTCPQCETSIPVPDASVRRVRCPACAFSVQVSRKDQSETFEVEVLGTIPVEKVAEPPPPPLPKPKPKVVAEEKPKPMLYIDRPSNQTAARRPIAEIEETPETPPIPQPGIPMMPIVFFASLFILLIAGGIWKYRHDQIEDAVRGKIAFDELEPLRPIAALIHDLKVFEKDELKRHRVLTEIEEQADVASPAIPQLLQTYEGADEITRNRIVAILQKIGTPAPAEYASVVPLLRSLDAALSNYAVQVLLQVRSVDLPLARLIIQQYGQANPNIQTKIYTTLAQAKGVNETQNLEIIQLYATAPSVELKLNAIERIGEFKLLNDSLVDLLGAFVSEPNARIREKSLALIEQLDKISLARLQGQLIANLKENNSAVQLTCLELLEKGGVPPLDYFERLLECLKSKDEQVLLRAKTIMEKVQFTTKDYNKLFTLLGNPSDAVRDFAMKGLGDLGIHATEASARVADYLNPEFALPIRLRAIGTLAKLQPKSSTIQAEVIRLATDSNESIAIAAMVTLSTMPRTEETIKPLLKQVDHPVESIQQAALAALRALMPFESSNLKMLLPGLNGQNSDLKLLILEGCAPIARSNRNQIGPAVEKLLEDRQSKGSVIQASCLLLSQLSPDYLPNLDTVLYWLSVTQLEPEAKVALGKLLVTLAPKLASKIVILRRALDNANQESGAAEYRNLLLQTLGQLGEPAVSAGPEIFAASLQETSRLAAWEAMRRVGGGLNPMLVGELKNRKPEVKLAAIRALKAVGSENANAVNRLTDISGNKSEPMDVRDEAKDAIAQILRYKKAR